MEEPKPTEAKKPICFLVIGMAGSGKTTLVQRLVSHMAMKKIPRYVINLDPAVHVLPYPVNIDIRSSVNYKEVMQEYGLGPNGAIVTSLNLFATQFDNVVRLCEAKQEVTDFIVVDTPGQIEVFTWSASGSIITDSLAVTFPTCVLYVMDTTRCASPATFMSNMLYACSILYKTRLPFVLCFNKCDAASSAQPLEWMKDYDALHSALQGESFMSNLTKSMSLVLQRFYETLTSVSCSAVTGEGIDALVDALKATRKEYENDFYAALMERKQKKENNDLEKVKNDAEEENEPWSDDE